MVSSIVSLLILQKDELLKKFGVGASFDNTLFIFSHRVTWRSALCAVRENFEMAAEMLFVRARNSCDCCAPFFWIISNDNCA